VEAQSGTIEAHSAAMEAPPGAMEAHFGTIGTSPGGSRSLIKAMDAHGALEAPPGALEVSPGALEANPGNREAQPGACGQSTASIILQGYILVSMATEVASVASGGAYLAPV
jgi:hypothetical protein